MDRHAALILLASGLALASPRPAAKKSPALHVRSIDLARRYVLVELSGISRPPAPNLYTFTDVRDRHYVALNVSCEPPSGTMMCQLQIPDGYERHKLAQLELHLGGLHSRTIAAPSAEIAAAWAAALAAPLEPSPSPSPKPSPRPSPKPTPRPSPSPRPHR